MAIESSRVGNWIHWSKEMALWEGWDEDEPYQALLCWQYLKGERDDGETDEALACAEHYMFACMAVAYGVPYAMMVFMVGVYQSTKAYAWLVDHSPGGALIRKATGRDPSSALKLGRGQVTGPSMDQIKWGEMGAADGRKIKSRGQTYYKAV